MIIVFLRYNFMELVTIDDLKSVSIGSIINECCSCEDMYYILWGEIEASKDPVAKKDKV